MEQQSEAISIENLLQNDQYIIPIYQRNYEWDKPQISKLIDDINSVSKKEKYYLGTLVTFKNNNDEFELIDGQQRHTTLNLLKSFLKSEKEEVDFNIHFQARSECEKFFRHLSNRKTEQDPFYENEKSKNLLQGYTIIQDVFKDQDIDKDLFREKLFESTYIFRTKLPADTDLNHYFEIMNNRGEQLEKHEILKAELMDKVDDSKKLLFDEIWSACSEMGDYVWNNFNRKLRDHIFKDNIKVEVSISKLNEEILYREANYNPLNPEKKEKTIAQILEIHKIPENFSQEDQEKTDKFRSVLDFPQLLLYTFNLLHPEKDHSFDDKKLLEFFKNYENAELFINKLLENRIYFDTYVIKNDLTTQDKNTKWGIRKYKIENNEFTTTESVFENSNEEDKIEMLQSMFYYSSVSENKKEWLLKILKYQPKTDKLLYEILFSDFKKNIQNLSVENLFYLNFAAKNFYYFEYMLWEVYNDYLKGENNFLKLSKDLLFIGERINKGLFENFRFRQLNSIEHLFAQNHIDKVEEIENKSKEKILNCFGNLCLISNSENSSAGKDHPEYKKNTYGENNVSLKRLVMLQTFSGEKGNTWNSNEILQHQKEMEAILNYFKNK
ncbi:Protein of unknown function [Epilithonimonas bovis DSM 19482]|uniref:DUF262 domain-containing protein n=1 Tax=Epilithonimonas bovis DSM 19482 TaxID=1121284 RepID=A0A1U7PPR8_9FLAO|nr:DUF262 domain-containing protein [Epilithonimonas bovis]SIT95596.1 Protein of unknown function [Epilithonimonas bovis DSM 19482]